MTIEIKRATLVRGSGALLFVAIVALLLRALPGPRRPFDYMVVGCFATTLVLMIAFIHFVKRRP